MFFLHLTRRLRPTRLAALALGLALALAPAAAMARDLYMVSVGITNAKGEAVLKATAKDARDMAAWGRAQVGKLGINVFVNTFTDSNATKANILNAIKNLRSRVKPADIVIFYDSSHGGLNKAGEFRMIAYDGALSFKEICEAFKGVAGTKVAIFDACHSGEAVTSAYGADLVVFSACRETELSFDGPATGNSQYTKHFLAGIKGKADYNKDHAVTFAEAARYAANRLNEFNKGRAANKQQHSMYSLPTGVAETLFISRMR